VPEMVFNSFDVCASHEKAYCAGMA
jgi:hypothetical protein